VLWRGNQTVTIKGSFCGQLVMAPFGSFAELQMHENMGTDYYIRHRCGCSGIAIMAIHGGGIEPGTTEIAEAVAGDHHSFYSFSGLKPAGNISLHISSRKFDEPQGIHIAKSSHAVVAIHGCRDAKAVTFIGGRHHRLKMQIKEALAAAGFPALDSRRFPGINPKNICNAGRSGMGVQLEISMAMRKRLFEDISRIHRKRSTPCFFDYVRAIQIGILSANPVLY